MLVLSAVVLIGNVYFVEWQVGRVSLRSSCLNRPHLDPHVPGHMLHTQVGTPVVIIDIVSIPSLYPYLLYFPPDVCTPHRYDLAFDFVRNGGHGVHYWNLLYLVVRDRRLLIN